MTNHFRGCDPASGYGLDPISVVAKVTSANGRPAVKLSDNLAKRPATGTKSLAILRIFGKAGMVRRGVAV